MNYEDHFLDLPFKGNRNYVRLADIFPALIELVQERFGLEARVDSLTIRRPLTRGILVSFKRSVTTSGSFRVRHGSECFPGWLMDTERSVPGRVPYDSSSLSDYVVAGSGFARILAPLPGHTEFDVLAGLMNLVARQVDPRFWWLCEMKLDSQLTMVYPVEVQLLHNLDGRCIECRILQGDIAIGSARLMLDHSDS